MEKILEYTDATGTNKIVGATDDIKISDIDITDKFIITLEDLDGNVAEFEVSNDGGPLIRPLKPR